MEGPNPFFLSPRVILFVPMSCEGILNELETEFLNFLDDALYWFYLYLIHRQEG